MPLVITAGQNTTFSMTMATTIDHIDITPATPTVQLARRIQLIATAKDGLNNVVLTASDKWQWSTVNPNNAAVDNTGIVVGIGTGTVQITATELESGLSGSTLLTVQPATGLVSWWRGEFNTKDSISGNDGTIYNGVTYTPGVVGEAFAFDGMSGAIAVPDVPSLEITKSLSIDARIYVKGLPPSDISPSFGMIVFRGDSRAGFDPYYLGLMPDGRLVFQIANEADVGTAIYATPPTGKWVHVTATLDDASGEMLLYLDGQIVAQQITGIRPLGNLDPTASPGIGIGNHAGFPNSNFNFAFNGDINEVQIYNTAIAPSL